MAMRPSRSLRLFGARFLVALVLAVALAASGIIGAYWFVNDKWNSVANANISEAVFTKAEKGKPANFLIIGSDSRAFVNNASEAQAFGSASVETGQRSDTIMIAHIDPATNTGMLVSIPRDLKAQVPGQGYTRINAAFNSGPQLLIQTIQQDFGIPINHYLEIDFAGFRDLVNAVGTVPIFFTTPARDLKTGLNIPLPGCYHLNGDSALAYVRSRYYEYKVSADDTWHSDPYSDLGRIQRQQYFVRSLAQVAITTAAHNPFKATDILDKGLKTLTKDRNLALSDARALVATLHDTNPGQLQTLTLPTKPSGDGATLVLDDAKAAPVLAQLRSLTPPKQQSTKSTSPPTLPTGVSPAQVSVKVLNGSGRRGAANTTLQALGARGFHEVPPAADADRTDYATTEIRYAPGAEHKAALVAAYLGVGQLTAGGNVDGSDVTVVLGRDFAQVGNPAASTTTPTTHAPTPATTANGPKANPAQTPGVGPQPLVGC
jgi:LCP family protein required for cell wall assembly